MAHVALASRLTATAKQLRIPPAPLAQTVPQPETPVMAFIAIAVERRIPTQANGITTAAAELNRV